MTTQPHNSQVTYSKSFRVYIETPDWCIKMFAVRLLREQFKTFIFWNIAWNVFTVTNVEKIGYIINQVTKQKFL